MGSLQKEAQNLMLKKLNNRLRFLKKRYGNRYTRTIWSWEDYCDFTCYWYNGEWTPDFDYHGIVQTRVNDVVEKVLENGIRIDNIQYFFRNPLDAKTIDYLHWNFKFNKNDIVYNTEIDYSIHCDDDDDNYNIDYMVDQNEVRQGLSYFEALEKNDDGSCLEEYEENGENEYNVECYGKTWGCPEYTNGTQFCCKHYCPYEFTEDPSFLDGENDPWTVEDWSIGVLNAFKK